MREQEDVERNVRHDGHRAGGQPAAERQQRGVVGGATAAAEATVHTLEIIAGTNIPRGMKPSATRRPQLIEEPVKHSGFLLYDEITGSKERFCAFYPSVYGEANMVLFDTSELVPDGSSVGSSYVPKTVIALPSTPDGQPMFTVQERIDPENVDRFPFDLIVYSSADQRDGTTHSFAAAAPDEQMMWVENFKQATRCLGMTGDTRLLKAPPKVQSATPSPRPFQKTSSAPPPVLRNEDGTMELTLHKGQMGFGVNVSDMAVVLDTRASAEEAGVAKGQVIVQINGADTRTKTDVFTALKASADSAKFIVRPPTLLEVRNLKKELLTVKMNKVSHERTFCCLPILCRTPGRFFVVASRAGSCTTSSRSALTTSLPRRATGSTSPHSPC